jgi:hypothetical protein
MVAFVTGLSTVGEGSGGGQAREAALPAALGAL